MGLLHIDQANYADLWQSNHLNGACGIIFFLPIPNVFLGKSEDKAIISNISEVKSKIIYLVKISAFIPTRALNGGRNCLALSFSPAPASYSVRSKNKFLHPASIFQVVLYVHLYMFTTS